MNEILKRRQAFRRKAINVEDDVEREINKKVYRRDAAYFNKVNVEGRNLEDGYRLFINDAIDGLQPAADLIRLLTSCKNNILTRPQKRNINKLTHKIAPGKPGHIQDHTVERWDNRIPELRLQWPDQNVDYDHLEIPINNTKLGPEWGYVSLETGWECCAFGCQCKDICYARKMEAGPTGKGIVFRVWRQQKQMRDLPVETLAEDFVDFIKEGKRGIRFCDTGGIPDQEMLEKVFAAVDLASQILIMEGLRPAGRFYIYSTRFDLNWDNLPEYLRVNASNKKLHDMIPSSNYFKIIEDDDEEDEERLFCSCNCEACDYCPEAYGEIIDQQGH